MFVGAFSALVECGECIFTTTNI